MRKIYFLLLLVSPSILADLRVTADTSYRGPDRSMLTLSVPLQFAVNERMQKNVDFWLRIYSQYFSYQGLVHDAKYVNHIYEVINFQESPEKPATLVKRSKQKWKTLLLSVHQKQKTPEKMNADEKVLFDSFADIDEPNKFLNAAHRKRLRLQQGQRDRFLEGLYQSGTFLPHMEALFKQANLPIELTRLPFVESSFNLRARSKVGASGIWQFMRSTAKLFITVNDAVDERNDPIRATEAAVKLLRLNYESLQNWPLAVTAYNHGRTGMMKAVRKVGSDDLSDLVLGYRSRSFGFASSNFFTELLAAIEIEQNVDKYFGKIERAKSLEFVEVKLPDFIELKTLLDGTHLDFEGVKELNPGLTEAVYTGRLLVPANYILRMPKAAHVESATLVQAFWDQYRLISDSDKLRSQRAVKYAKKGKSSKHPKTRRELQRSSVP